MGIGKREQCPKCGSTNIFKCQSKREANGDCFQCGGCNALLPNDELVSRYYRVTTYDELVDACQGMLNWAQRVKGPNPGMEVFNAVQALHNAKPRKAGKK